MSIWFNSKSPEDWLSNFSGHPVSVGGHTYGSVEHGYQAAKFSRGSEMFNRVCSAATPAEAKAAAQAAPALEHWLAIREHVMRAALSAKFSHRELQERLRGTGNRVLVHESKDDLYWGRRRDSGEGANRLGVMLMELREFLLSHCERTTGDVDLGGYPDSVVINLPHDSTFVPPSVRQQFLLDDYDLAQEIARLTDHRTLDLFTSCADRHLVVRAPVSRLVVDCERFLDEREVLTSRGLGAIYEVTSNLSPLRRPLREEERAQLLRLYYHPHHFALEDAVQDAIRRAGHCVILDAHSFPDIRLGYEVRGTDATRPDVCLGIDEAHTGRRLVDCFVDSFAAAGFSTAINHPFAGTIVPERMLLDRRVQSIMVEVNRRLYMRSIDEVTENFDNVAATVQQCCARALRAAGFQ